VVEKIEILMNKAKKYIVKPDRSNLISVHKDRNLTKIQSLLSSKIFALFYRNYIDSLRAKWSCNAK